MVSNDVKQKRVSELEGVCVGRNGSAEGFLPSVRLT
jgi:hypothetical protein